MDQSWWASAIQWTVWGIVMTVVMGWVAKSRFKVRPQPEARWLVHPPSTLIIGILGFGFFAGIAVISNIFPNKTVTWWTTATFVGFALLSVPMIADYFLSRHKVSEVGMEYGKLTGSRRFLKWCELRRFKYAPVMKWFRLETQSGHVARVWRCLSVYQNLLVFFWRIRQLTP